MTPTLEKVTFQKKGWSYRSAAPKLGVSYQYLCDVLNGRRTSRRLLKKVHALPGFDSTTPQYLNHPRAMRPDRGELKKSPSVPSAKSAVQKS